MGKQSRNKKNRKLGKFLAEKAMSTVSANPFMEWSKVHLVLPMERKLKSELNGTPSSAKKIIQPNAAETIAVNKSRNYK